MPMRYFWLLIQLFSMRGAGTLGSMPSVAATGASSRMSKAHTRWQQKPPKRRLPHCPRRKSIGRLPSSAAAEQPHLHALCQRDTTLPAR